MDSPLKFFCNLYLLTLFFTFWPFLHLSFSCWLVIRKVRRDRCWVQDFYMCKINLWHTGSHKKFSCLFLLMEDSSFLLLFFYKCYFPYCSGSSALGHVFGFQLRTLGSFSVLEFPHSLTNFITPCQLNIIESHGDA